MFMGQMNCYWTSEHLVVLAELAQWQYEKCNQKIYKGITFINNRY